MEILATKFAEAKNALWKTKLGLLVSTLQARLNQQGPPRDSLAEHEESARRRGEPAYFDRVKKLKQEESKSHHNPWA